MKLEIDLNPKQVEYLKQLQDDYRFQVENDQAKYPNIYVLVDYKEIVVDPEFESECELFYCDSHGEHYRIPEDDLESYLKERYPEEFQEYMIKFKAENDDEDFSWEWTEDVDGLLKRFEIYGYHAALTKTDIQTFFTLSDAENHLKSCRKDYHEKAFVDRRKPYRSDQMIEMLLFLYNLPIHEVVTADREGVADR